MKKLKILFLISFPVVLLACNDRTSRNRDNDQEQHQNMEQNRNMEQNHNMEQNRNKEQDQDKTKRDTISEGSLFFSWETLVEQQVDRC